MEDARTRRELQQEIVQLKEIICKVSAERDSYKVLYETIAKKWHPSPGRKPIYTDGTAATLFLEHYYEGRTIRSLMSAHKMPNATVQRLIRKKLLEVVDDLSSGRTKISNNPEHREVEIKFCRSVIQNGWYTSEYMRQNIECFLESVCPSLDALI